MLIAHITIALISVIHTAYVYFAPTESKLHVSYGLVVLTIASGTYLVVSTHAPMLQACVSGLMYVGVVLTGIVSAHRKLARELNKTD